MITGKFPSLRLRRTRKYTWSRRLIQENNLSCNDFIYPIFLMEGKNNKQSIKPMPDVYRYTIDKLGGLVSNAIKYSKPDFKDRLIKFKIEEFDNFFLISIEDNGIGIAKNDIQRIFERFFRADRSRSVKGKLGSSGLGLAIAKHIIEAHGMVIRVTSNLGIGTKFSITIAKP